MILRFLIVEHSLGFSQLSQFKLFDRGGFDGTRGCHFLFVVVVVVVVVVESIGVSIGVEQEPDVVVELGVE